MTLIPLMQTAAGAAPDPGSTLQRARLQIEGGSEIPCWFNPREYTITKVNEWRVEPVVGRGLPKAQFTGGQARELTLDLLFDASDQGPDGSVKDVCEALFTAMEIRATGADDAKNSGRPPLITFSWGATRPFAAAAKQLSVQY